MDQFNIKCSKTPIWCMVMYSRHVIVLVFVFWSILFLSSEATDNGSHPIRPPEKLRKIGEIEYGKILTLASNEQDPEASCWQKALNYFHSLNESCDMMQETTKSLISLTLTKCHYTVRPNGFPGPKDGCDPEAAPVNCDSGDVETNTYTPANGDDTRNDDGDETRNDNGTRTDDETSRISEAASTTPGGKFDQARNEKATGDKEQTPGCRTKRMSTVYFCKSQMSESAFAVFIQFLNHVDSICFYVQSTLWQSRTENTISRLSSTANDVIIQLEDAKNEQLKLALESLHEREKLKSFFDEVFYLVYRMQNFQRLLSAQLSDFGTWFIYAILIVVTYYLTGTKATQRCRLSIYLIWSLMLFVEVIGYRFIAYTKNQILDIPFQKRVIFYEQFSSSELSDNSTAFSRFLNLANVAVSFAWRHFMYFASMIVYHWTDEGFRSFIGYWRMFCAGWAAFIYISAWWSFKDPTIACLEAVEAVRCGLEDVKRLASTGQMTQMATSRRLSISPQRKKPSGILTPLWHLLAQSGHYDDSDNDSEYDPSDTALSSLNTDGSINHHGTATRTKTALAVGCSSRKQRGFYRTSMQPALESCVAAVNSPTHVTALCGSQRRNPPRKARPKSFVLPKTMSESVAMNVNPILYRETSEMFAQEMELRRLRTIVNQMDNPDNDYDYTQHSAGHQDYSPCHTTTSEECSNDSDDSCDVTREDENTICKNKMLCNSRTTPTAKSRISHNSIISTPKYRQSASIARSRATRAI